MQVVNFVLNHLLSVFFYRLPFNPNIALAYLAGAACFVAIFVMAGRQHRAEELTERAPTQAQIRWWDQTRWQLGVSMGVFLSMAILSNAGKLHTSPLLYVMTAILIAHTAACVLLAKKPSNRNKRTARQMLVMGELVSITLLVSMYANAKGLERGNVAFLVSVNSILLWLVLIYAVLIGATWVIHHLRHRARSRKASPAPARVASST